MPRWLPRLSTCVLLAAPCLVSAKSDATDPWQDALTFNYNAAAERFAALHAKDPADARTAIGYASSLLVKQPRTDSNIRQSRDILLKVRETAPASGEETILALYLLARIELDHLDPAQPDSALARLEQLRKDHPAHPLADHSAVEIAYLLIYKPQGIDVSVLPKVEAMLATIKAPDAARDLNALLAAVKLRRLKDPAAALVHYRAARAVGYEQPLRDADADLVIANLARETGDLELARKHYAAFVKAAPRDVRASTVRRLLNDLDRTANRTDAR